MLNPFKAVRRGPELFAVTTLPEESGASCVEAQKKQRESSECQDQFRESFFMHFPHLERAQGQRGPQNAAKLAPGATVAASFDISSDPFKLGVLSLLGANVVEEAMARHPNLNQGYGKVVNVHYSTAGHATSVDVSFEGLWSQEYATAVALHYHTEAGFYASVHPDRLIAHANFRNIFLTTTLYDLRYELALVWDKVLDPHADIAFIDSATGQHLPHRVGKTIRQLVEGSVAVEIHGCRVGVLDPMSVLPKGLW